MSSKIADIARSFEEETGHEISYKEMSCNQFVVAVLKRAVDVNFPSILADDFPQHTAFSRVTQALAGDLIHWPGHIGIVLNPSTGEFIGSQTSTGVAVSNYKQGYWNGEFGGKKPDVFLRHTKTQD